LSVRLLASGVPRAVLERIAPRPDVTLEPCPRWAPDGTGALRIEFGIDSLAGLHGVVASLSSTSPGGYAFQFGMRVTLDGGGRSEWARLTRIGLLPGDSAASRAAALEQWSIATDRTPPGAASGPGIRGDVDTFLLDAPAGHGEFEVRVWPEVADAFVSAPCLLAISGVRDPATATTAVHDGLGDVPPIPMPAISQIALGGPDAMRVCSPTSVAMVLGALGFEAEPGAVTRLAYAAAHDRYGVWPFNVWAASRWGAIGYVGVIDSWDCARALLENGVPLVISEAHGPGDLPGSPLPETDGHLLVLRGIRGGMALVHDPAAPEDAGVPREYRVEDLARAWLGHGGAAYILVRPVGNAPAD
jgi:hypothetical protein